VPAAGEIVIFNRSHYEDVLVPVVKGWITAERRRRFAQINDFERCWRERHDRPQVPAPHLEGRAARALQERLDDPTKHWKFAGGDLEERKPGTPTRPRTRGRRRDRARRGRRGRSFRRFEDAPQPDDRAAVKEALVRSKLRYPPGDPALSNIQRDMTELKADYKALADYRPAHKVRFVTAASLFDGHDAAINIMRRILQGMGAEVVHLGHNRSVDEVVTAALQEDVQGIAISSYQGGHVEYFKYMVDLLRSAAARTSASSAAAAASSSRARSPSCRPTASSASTAPRTASAWAWPG
jgi:methylmalonyl-CoA mutase cobalamin-binding subunit